MIVLLEKMAMLVLLIALGYLCSRSGLIGPEFNKGISRLVINVFLPAMILSSVINQKLQMTGGEIAFGFLMMVIMVAICYVVGRLTPKILRIKDGDKGMYSLLVSFMNNGFMGFPLVAALFGDTWVFFASLSNIPFNFLLYTLGIMQLQSGEEKEKLRLRSILNAPLIATFAALILFVFNIPIPALIDDTVDTVANATVPLSMMSIGLSLGSVPIKDAFIHKRLYALSALRLIVCPLLVWFVLHFIVADPIILGIIVVISACPSAVVCSILGIKYGRDGIEASEMIFLCTVLSVITMPLLMTVLGLK